MKTIAVFTTLTLGLFQSLSAQPNTPPGSQETNTPAWQPGHAEVRQVRGTAQFSTNGTDWNAVRVGMMLAPGTVVQTSAKSTLDLSLGKDIGSVRVEPDSRLGVETMLRAGNARSGGYKITLNLLRGDIAIQTSRNRKDSAFEIQLPNGVAGLRCKGKYEVSADGSVTASPGGNAVVALVDASGGICTQVIAPSPTGFSHRHPFNDQPR